MAKWVKTFEGFIPGLPAEVTDEQAKALGVEDLLAQAIKEKRYRKAKAKSSEPEPEKAQEG